MKTIIIILCTFALIITFDIGVNNYFEKEMRYYNNNISKIVKCINDEDFTQAHSLLDELETQWNKNKKRWNMLCDHYEIEEISVLLNQASVNFENSSYDDTLIDLHQLQCCLKFTSMRYNILLENII